MGQSFVMTDQPEPPHSNPLPPGETEEPGRLAENVLYFARALRAAGIPVGPGAVLDALEAVEDRRRRHARGFLLDAARGVREAPRAYHPVRSGVPHLLPPPRLYRSAHGDDDAAGAGDGAASAAGRRDARARGALFRARRQTEKRARDRARRADDGVRPRSAAKEGFRADDRRRNRRGESGDAAAGFAARRGAYAAAGAASATVISSTSAARCAPA